MSTYRKTEKTTVIVQPLDGYAGAAVGPAFEARVEDGSVNPDTSFEDMQEIIPDRRELSDSQLSQDGGTFTIMGYMRVPTHMNFHGFLLRWALGTNPEDNQHIDQLALAGVGSVANTVTAIPNESFQSTPASPRIASNDFAFFKRNADTDWEIFYLNAVNDPSTGAGTDANVAYTQKDATKTYSGASFDWRTSRFIMGQNTVYADVYIKYGDTDGEVCRSAAIGQLDVTFSSGSIKFSASGNGKTWEAITTVTGFPLAYVKAEGTQLFKFLDYVKEVSLPANAAYNGDVTLTINNNLTQFRASNERDPVESILGNPIITLNGTLFQSLAKNLKKESKEETAQNLRFAVKNKNAMLGLSINGTWQNITSNIGGVRQITTYSGLFKANQTTGASFTFFAADNRAMVQPTAANRYPDTDPPESTMLIPNGLTQVSGTITLTASALDNKSLPANMTAEFFVNAVSAGNGVYNATTNVYELTGYDTTLLTNGNNNIYVTVTDEASNAANSPTIVFDVNN